MQRAYSEQCDGVAVAEIVLHRSEIGSLIGKKVAARVPQHVRMDTIDLCGLAGRLHHIVDSATRQWLTALRQKNQGKTDVGHY
jgi:hypothetical protein